jgi:hypothetical protein
LVIDSSISWLFTSNIRDFSETELTAELGQLPPGCSLRFESDLNSFIANHARAALEQLAVLANQLRQHLTLPGVNLHEELTNLSSEVLSEMAHKLRIRKYEYDKIEQPYYIEEFHPPKGIDVQEVYRAEDEVMVECSASYDCMIEGYMFKSDVYGLTDEQAIHVTEWDWNEHYSGVEFYGTIEVHLLLQLSEDNAKPQETQVQYSLQKIEVVGSVLGEH